SGDMAFAMPIPKEALAIGESISEGYCTGPLWLANRREVDSMPEGAIVLADHAEDWMLESKFLKRAGGFVLAEAGFNDHVAILLRQEQITLMRAGDHYSALASQEAGQQATLACARFNDEPGAFIVAGDLAGKLASHRSLSTAFSDLPSTKVIPSRDDLSPPEGTFRLVASGFQWLTDQNARLLAFFAPGGGLDCLANPVKLSMSPQRSELLSQARGSVNRLVDGAESLLDGYGAYLRLADNKSAPQIQPLLDELPELRNRFEALKQTIESELERITYPLQASKEGQVSFSEWMAACHQLQICLQALNPKGAKQVRSVHELIFALHRRFVNALAPIALASGRGNISSGKYITYVDCRTLSETAPLLSPACKATLDAIVILDGIVISMDEALIVNMKLGIHVSLIELLEQAEGGKGRTLRLKFTDEFASDSSYKSGKLKRMWFLAQLLKAIGLNENAGTVNMSCNAVAGEMIVECSRMKSRQVMQDAFEKLIIVLGGMCGLDTIFEERAIFERVKWDFNVLAQHLNSDVTTEADRFVFKHALFSMFYVNSIGIIPAFCRLLSNQREFIQHAHQLGVCQCLIFFERKSKESFREIFMSDEISDETRKEVLPHLLLLDPKRATRLYEDVYPHLRDKYFVINPSHDYALNFAIPPDEPLWDHKEKVEKALLEHGLKYASKRVRKDYSYLKRIR
ncbi:hypothetical protein, partial [Endozoicomonas sp. ONNA1]|uniref:hypothetical protein n=1 Tax=Endozoicomonas sp. ONNA1 TaxID=2828740 RepID=UPI0021478509